MEETDLATYIPDITKPIIGKNIIIFICRGMEIISKRKCGITTQIIDIKNDVQYVLYTFFIIVSSYSLTLIKCLLSLAIK